MISCEQDNCKGKTNNKKIYRDLFVFRIQLLAFVFFYSFFTFLSLGQSGKLSSVSMVFFLITFPLSSCECVRLRKEEVVQLHFVSWTCMMYSYIYTQDL